MLEREDLPGQGPEWVAEPVDSPLEAQRRAWTRGLDDGLEMVGWLQAPVR